MSDRIDTEAVPMTDEYFDRFLISSVFGPPPEEIRRAQVYVAALRSELDRTRKALRPFAEYATAMMDGLPDHVAVARIDLPKLAHVEITRADIYAARAALTEGNTERPATMDTGLVEVRQVRCPTCGSDDPKVLNDPCDGWGDIDVAQEPDPWHNATDTEGEG